MPKNPNDSPDDASTTTESISPPASVISSPGPDSGYTTDGGLELNSHLLSGSHSQDLADEMPLDTLITVHPCNKGISSTLTINLDPYVDSFKTDKQAHERYKVYFAEQLTIVQGAFLWEKMLQCAMNNAIENGRMNTNQQTIIELSPIKTFLNDSFIEVIKNLMDEAILGSYALGTRAQLTLTVDIDLSDSDCICLTLTDDGRGFSPSFVEKVSTPQGRSTYIMEATPTHKEQENKAFPRLFGGSGLGLRILMAQVLLGSDLSGPGVIKEQYEKPIISEIILRNHAGSSGAEIQIRTSQSPLKEKEKPAETHEVCLLPPIQRIQKKLKGSPPKPITAVEMSHVKEAIEAIRSTNQVPELSRPKGLKND